MGRPKQLLPYRGSTLVRHAAETALASRCRPIVVVVGANAIQTSEALAGLDLQIAVNTDWERGIGSSIRTGIEHLLQNNSLEAVAIMLCDQPRVSGEVLNQLIETRKRSGATIAACSYSGIAGVPAVFDASLLPELQKLPDAVGARQIITQHYSYVALVSFPSASIDVDTPHDFEQLT